jgi:uncharacterized membrane protein HdeD (DUF308 family)
MRFESLSLPELSRRWGWLLALGVLLAVTGWFALGYAVLTTLASVMVLGTLLMISGIAEVALAFASRCWRGFTLHLLLGLLLATIGVLFFARPGISAAVLTFSLAVLFIAGGTMRILYSAIEQFRGWGWSLFSGAIGLLLGLFVLTEWPLSGAWFLGVYLGIDLMFLGATWIALALQIRHDGKIERPMKLELQVNP